MYNDNTIPEIEKLHQCFNLQLFDNIVPMHMTSSHNVTTVNYAVVDPRNICFHHGGFKIARFWYCSLYSLKQLEQIQSTEIPQ